MSKQNTEVTDKTQELLNYMDSKEPSTIKDATCYLLLIRWVMLMDTSEIYLLISYYLYYMSLNNLAFIFSKVSLSLLNRANKIMVILYDFCGF